MKPEQLIWTDKQWATHLGCAAHDVKRVQEYITQNYFPVIKYSKQSGYYFCHINKKQEVSSGVVCYLLYYAAPQSFLTFDAAQQFANEQFFADLKLSESVEKKHNIPRNALQMLHLR